MHSKWFSFVIQLKTIQTTNRICSADNVNQEVGAIASHTCSLSIRKRENRFRFRLPTHTLTLLLALGVQIWIGMAYVCQHSAEHVIISLSRMHGGGTCAAVENKSHTMNIFRTEFRTMNWWVRARLPKTNRNYCDVVVNGAFKLQPNVDKNKCAQLTWAPEN